MQNKSKDIGDVLGDAGELQEKKATLIALMESRSRKSPELEAVIDAGEKLYSHTSPDGREIIRQQIKWVITTKHPHFLIINSNFLLRKFK